MTQLSTGFVHPAASFKKNELIILLIILGVLSFSVYGNTFLNGWTYDDFPVIVENQNIRSFADFFGQSLRFGSRPLREFSLLIDYKLFGLTPQGYHFQNILWHALNGFLLYVVLRRLTAGRLPAVLASVLFLVHPLQVEVVANISHRKDSLALFFSLLSFLLFHVSYDVKRRKLLWLLASLFAFLLAFSAKQSALVLPLIKCAYDFCQPKTERLFFKTAWQGMSALFIVVSSSVVWFLSNGLDTFVASAQGYLVRQNFFGLNTAEIINAHLLLVLKSWVLMWSKLVWPIDLAVEYTPGVPGSWFDPWVVSALFLLGIYFVCIGYFWRRQKRTLVFALLVFGLAWLPTSNLYPFSYYAADRYMYMPSVAFFTVVGWLLFYWISQNKTTGGVVTILMICALVFLTVQQNKVWRSPKTLWTQAVKVSPNASYALNNMGMVSLQKNDLQTAYDYFARAAAINKFNPTAQYNLGYLNEQSGNTREAILFYQKFLQLDHPQFKNQREMLRQHLKLRYGIEY